MLEGKEIGCTWIFLCKFLSKWIEGVITVFLQLFVCVFYFFSFCISIPSYLLFLLKNKQKNQNSKSSRDLCLDYRSCVHVCVFVKLAHIFSHQNEKLFDSNNFLKNDRERMSSSDGKKNNEKMVMADDRYIALLLYYKNKKKRDKKTTTHTQYHHRFSMLSKHENPFSKKKR